MRLKNGDLFFVDKGTMWGDTVGWFQGNRYHHIGIVIRLFGEIYVFEAIGVGMAFTPIKEYKEKIAKKGYTIEIKRLAGEGFDTIERADYASICLPLTCVGYEFKNLIGFQAIRFVWLKLTGRNLWIGRSQKVKNNRMICSELVAYIYFKLFGMFSEDWHKVAPSDLYANDKFITVGKMINK
jgi:hypothetical protein